MDRSEQFAGIIGYNIPGRPQWLSEMGLVNNTSIGDTAKPASALSNPGDMLTAEMR